MIVFIDGENIVCRYQNMIKKGWIPTHHNFRALEDTYIWHANLLASASFWGEYEVIRANYYTYAVGDDAKVDAIKDQIRSLAHSVGHASLPNKYTPVVFRKLKRSARAKGVDIRLTVDMLTYAFNDAIDTAYLLSGDGDYLPLIEQVKRLGKHVFISAFSDGLHPEVPRNADAFSLLDPIFFPQRDQITHQVTEDNVTAGMG